MSDDIHIPGLPESDCMTCPEGTPPNECDKSLRPCGHHCNCSWVHDCCHWCGAEFGEDGEVTFAEERIVVAAS